MWNKNEGPRHQLDCSLAPAELQGLDDWAIHLLVDAAAARTPLELQGQIQEQDDKETRDTPKAKKPAFAG